MSGRRVAPITLRAEGLRWSFGPSGSARAESDPTGAFELGPLDLELGPGIWHLEGGNGSGKTTLLRLLAGELSPQAGRVTLHGHDLARDAAARAHVGLLRVEPDLPGFLTVEEGWRLLAALRGRPDWDGRPLSDALDLPGGLVLERGSAGQRRKGELLAALAGDPEVLLLDEVFATLDARSVRVVAGWLEGWRDRVVVLTGHDALPVRPDGRLAPLREGARRGFVARPGDGLGVGAGGAVGAAQVAAVPPGGRG